MSARSSIVDALVTKFKTINGTGAFQSNLYNNVFNKMKFYDEISDYPTLCVVAGYENREYHPGDFKWGFVNISIKIYVKDEESADALEKVISDVELIVHDNEQLSYGADNTTEILITSIQTDEGVLSPIGVGEINLIARYQVL